MKKRKYAFVIRVNPKSYNTIHNSSILNIRIWYAYVIQSTTLLGIRRMNVSIHARICAYLLQNHCQSLDAKTAIKCRILLITFVMECLIVPHVHIMEQHACCYRAFLSIFHMKWLVYNWSCEKRKSKKEAIERGRLMGRVLPFFSSM